MGQECRTAWFLGRGSNLELPWCCEQRNSDSEMYTGSRHEESYCGTEPSFPVCRSRELITRKCSFPLMEWFGSLTPVHTLTLGILDTWVNPWCRSYTSSPWAWLVRDSSSRQLGTLCKDISLGDVGHLGHPFWNSSLSLALSSAFEFIPWGLYAWVKNHL